ncbi:MAG: phosphatase PAP2 family protein [Ruminococcaceae bacterium]|nr:phosphatase PAP2 family protein [Oscillospiraceae bacterium]
MSEFLLEWEGAALLWIQEYLRGPLTDPVFSFYTQLGNVGMIWIALSLLMLCFKRTRRAGVAGLLALAVGFVLTNLTIKPLVGRVRPWLTVEGLNALVTEHDPHSFPSGHTCAALAAACAWRPYLPKRWGNAALICAVLMGLSRLYVGVHFPTDVLAGAVIGCLSGWAVNKKILSHR